MNASTCTRVVRTASLAATVALLASCAGTSQPATPGAINDKAAPIATRIDSVRRADEFVSSGDLDASTAREALKRVVWERSAPTELRVAAIDQLLLDDSQLADTRRLFALMLPTEPDPEVVSRMGIEGAERGWTDLAPPIVRRWSRVVAGRDGKVRNDDPERESLSVMFPGVAPQDVVLDVFLDRMNDGGEAMRERDRVEAWGLLMALEPDEARLISRLTSESVPDDALSASVVWAARELHAVPRTGEQLAWVRRLQEPAHAEFRSRAAAIISGLTPDQRRGWALRHMAGAVYTSDHHPDRLSRSRAELLALAADRLKGRVVYRRENAGTLTGETLKDAGDGLSWGEALLLHAAIDATDDAALPGPLFVSAERDRQDTTTEYGGLIDAPASRGFSATTYPPRPTERFGDDRFIASEEMLKAGDTSLFFFHFHAGEYTNRRYAGPSDGDLDYTRRFGRCGLVFTFVSTTTMNADFYTPAGVVVDLGAVTRTAGGGPAR